MNGRFHEEADKVPIPFFLVLRAMIRNGKWKKNKNPVSPSICGSTHTQQQYLAKFDFASLAV